MMQEELIEKLIRVEGDARKLKEEGQEELRKLRDKYQQRMAREERVRLDEARKKGRGLVESRVAEAEKYSSRLEEEMKRELKEIEEKYLEVKDNLLEKYFQKIIGFEGE